MICLRLKLGCHRERLSGKLTHFQILIGTFRHRYLIIAITSQNLNQTFFTDKQIEALFRRIDSQIPKLGNLHLNSSNFLTPVYHQYGGCCTVIFFKLTIFRSFNGYLIAIHSSRSHTFIERFYIIIAITGGDTHRNFVSLQQCYRAIINH